MKRWIYTYRTIEGSPTAIERTLLRRSRDLLALATAVTDADPDGDGSFLVELETEVAHLNLAKQIRVSTSVAVHKGRRVVIPIGWRADPGRWLFPVFEGTLEWEALDGYHGQLTLCGMYETPLGLLGGAADVTVLRDVALRTADHLVASLARELARVAAAPSPPEALPSRRQRGPLHVRDVMSPNPLVLDESLPLRTAALVLAHGEVSGAPVVSDAGELVGVLSEADLLVKEADERFRLTGAAEDRRRDATNVGEACTRPARTTSPDARLAAATRVMLDHDVSRLVVVGEGRIVGILARHDVLAALIRDDVELLNEVRQQLDVRGAGDIRASVEWGHVTLQGTTQLRTTATVLARVVSHVDGVVTVDADDLHWSVDDIMPRQPMHM